MTKPNFMALPTALQSDIKEILGPNRIKDLINELQQMNRYAVASPLWDDVLLATRFDIQTSYQCNIDLLRLLEQYIDEA